MGDTSKKADQSANLDDSLERSMRETPKTADTSQFPLLSQTPVKCGSPRMTESDVDKMELLKVSPRPDPEEKIDKNKNAAFQDGLSLIRFGVKQAKHQKAIHQELRTLLEHEKSLLTQLLSRCEKFSGTKDENKKKMDEFEADYNKKLSNYSEYFKKLIEVPDDPGLNQDDADNQSEMQQKMLCKIVEEAGSVSKNALVQFSIQNTLLNDIDVSLSKIKQFCNKMLRILEQWMKRLNFQENQYDRVADQWDRLYDKAKEIRGNSQDGAEDMSGPAMKNLIQQYEERLNVLESSVRCIASRQGLGSTSPPPDPSRSVNWAQMGTQGQRPCPPSASSPSAAPTAAAYVSPASSPPSRPDCHTFRLEQPVSTMPGKSRDDCGGLNSPGKSRDDCGGLNSIQEGLKKLDKKNKQIEELVSCFKEIRTKLTEEMDKAVKLNHKLQQDLQLVSLENAAGVRSKSRTTM